MLKKLAVSAALFVASQAHSAFLVQDYDIVRVPDYNISVHAELYTTPSGDVDHFTAFELVSNTRTYTLADLRRIDQRNIFFTPGFSDGNQLTEGINFEVLGVNRQDGGVTYIFNLLRLEFGVGPTTGGTGIVFHLDKLQNYTETLFDLPTPAVAPGNFTSQAAASLVPVPGVWALLGLGLVGLGIRPLRRKFQ